MGGSEQILVIVESPGKISKISKYLGSKYIVKACVGIFRDLDPTKMSVDFDNGFEPEYIITKPDVVRNLRSALKGVSTIYLATDNDVEGHGMAQALYEVLRPKKYKRILFNEISKKAILAGIKNATDLDPNQSAAQKTRRVIDRLFGYMVSPIVMNQVGGRSAGRVQSAALRIVVDKEIAIKNFTEKNAESSSFKVGGKISGLKIGLCGFDTTEVNMKKIGKAAYKGKSQTIPLGSTDQNKYATAFLKNCLKSKFTVHSVEEKPGSRSPTAPFTTSTLQQEANRKHGLNIDLTMKIAQKLYEDGWITYMRTDSVMISEDAHAEIKEVIEKDFGKKYYKRTDYKNKNSSAQLAHECVRPVHPNIPDIETEGNNDPLHIKLYKLIWKRTIASQMQPAKLAITTIQIDISKYVEDVPKIFYYVQSQIDKVVFKGFMKVYVESTDDEEEVAQTDLTDTKIPAVGDVLIMEEITAKQDFLRPPVRYTQASLVKKLEESGIGRPATYVNTIKTIIDRSYIEVGNVAGVKKDIVTLSIRSESKKHVMSIDEAKSSIQIGKETKKLIPTSLGQTVTEYLVENFPTILDYDFTAKMETDMDAVADGSKVWNSVVKKFYDRLNPIVQSIGTSGPSVYTKSARELGEDSDGNKVVALKTKEGYAVARVIGKQSYYANIPKEKLKTIKLKEAVAYLNDAVRILGSYEKADVSIRKSKAGAYYISYGKKQYCPIDAEVDHTKLKLKHAIKLIDTYKTQRNENVIAEFSLTEGKNTNKAVVLKGKGTYPPYIQVTRGKIKTNYSIYPGVDPTKLTEKNIKGIIDAKKNFNKSKNGGSKTAKKPKPKAKGTDKPKAKGKSKAQNK